MNTVKRTLTKDFKKQVKTGSLSRTDFKRTLPYVQDLYQRAEIMLEQAEKIDSRAFVTAKVRTARGS
jgi:hypothetical protein